MTEVKRRSEKKESEYETVEAYGKRVSAFFSRDENKGKRPPDPKLIAAPIEEKVRYKDGLRSGVKIIKVSSYSNGISKRLFKSQHPDKARKQSDEISNLKQQVAELTAKIG